MMPQHPPIDRIQQFSDKIVGAVQQTEGAKDGKDGGATNCEEKTAKRGWTSSPFPLQRYLHPPRPPMPTNQRPKS
jgi:hypothetical protein